MISAPSPHCVVYDIDGVLCTTNVRSLQEVAFYAKYGLILTVCKVTHYVFPGVKEAMWASFDEFNGEVYFYSRGVEERNTRFVYKLMKRTFGKERALEITKRRIVHTVRRKIYVGDPEERKDLRLISEETKNTILVDDSSGLVMPDQRGSHLYAYEPRFSSDNPFCDADGYKRIKEAGEVVIKVYHEPNYLFYYVGMLFLTLRESREKGIPVSDILPRRQWRESSFRAEFYSIFDDAYYEAGLSILRRYNENLTFMSPLKYKAIQSLPFTPEEEALYNKYLKSSATE